MFHFNLLALAASGRCEMIDNVISYVIVRGQKDKMDGPESPPAIKYVFKLAPIALKADIQSFSKLLFRSIGSTLEYRPVVKRLANIYHKTISKSVLYNVLILFHPRFAENPRVLKRRRKSKRLKL